MTTPGSRLEHRLIGVAHVAHLFLGYGDIVPTSPISRMLASIEAITGQLYFAVLVTRLISMHIVYSMSQA